MDPLAQARLLLEEAARYAGRRRRPTTIAVVRLKNLEVLVTVYDERELRSLRDMAKRINRRVTVRGIPTISVATAKTEFWRTVMAVPAGERAALRAHLEVLDALAGEP